MRRRLAEASPRSTDLHAFVLQLPRFAPQISFEEALRERDAVYPARFSRPASSALTSSTPSCESIAKGDCVGWRRSQLLGSGGNG